MKVLPCDQYRSIQRNFNSDDKHIETLNLENENNNYGYCESVCIYKRIFYMKTIILYQFINQYFIKMLSIYFCDIEYT